MSLAINSISNPATTTSAVSPSSDPAPMRSGASSTAPPNSVADGQSNNAPAQSGYRIDFVVGQTMDHVIAKVIDTKTNEVLQQVSADSMFMTAKVLAKLLAKGVFIDSLA